MKKLFILIAIIAIGNIAMAQCNPSFTYSESSSGSGINYLNVVFSNTTAFTPNDSEVVHYSYDYGDGTSGYSDQHSFATAGTYTVVLSMEVDYSDSLGLGNNIPICSNTYSQSVTVGSACATEVTTAISNVTGSTATLNVAANTPAGASGMTYAWNFGDGNAGSGASTSHTYTSPGLYTITLTATNGSCTYTNSITQQPIVIMDCDSFSAGFTYTASNNTAYFANTSNASDSFFYSLGIYLQQMSSWDFGDGNTGIGDNPSHTYATAGTYNVTVTTMWQLDSTIVGFDTCTHTATESIIVTGPPNRIAGYVVIPNTADTAGTSNIKVWLIKLDSNIISAVDSVTAYYDVYQFDNKPNGVYLVKAALINNPTAPGLVGIVPTYDSASLYWSGAANINHTGGDDENNNIFMQVDTVTSGPGFVAGDVLTGAGKGTGAGEPVAGLLIYLRNTATNSVVAFQYTDASGNYTFSNIPLGNYDTYPESTGYATTPYSFTISNSQTTANNIDFRENASTMTITPITTGINNVNANATKITMYPNPASSQVTIQYHATAAQAAHIDITNVLGQKVYDAPFNINSGNGAARLDVSALAGGLYMVNITSDNGIDYSQKLMIQR